MRTLGVVALSMGLLFGADTFLAKTEESEGRIQAAGLYKEGKRLLDMGSYAEAADRLNDALIIDRGNRGYQLALARAQLGDGQATEAEATIDGLLVSDSTDGPANLAMARVLLKEGRVREAISYYHRAVYGQWKDDPEGNRLKIRFELIDLLAKQNSKEELLAELLAVEEEAPDDTEARLRIGRLFLAAGSPSHAAEVFRDVVRNVVKDEPGSTAASAAYEGIGESEFKLGDYRAAIAAFSSAIKSNPADLSLNGSNPNAQAASRGMELANEVLALDPTQRGLDASERLRRSRILLQKTLDATTACSGAILPEDLVKSSEKELKESPHAGRPDSAAETDLDLAEKLWQVRKVGCGPPASDDPLALALAKVSQ